VSRLREASYCILAGLLDGPAHGYGILKRVMILTDGRVRLTTGTLYSTLDRLLAQELITRGETEIVEGRVRHYYKITEQGVAAVVAEAERRAATAEAVKQLARARSAGPGKRSTKRPAVS
jgi:DNA-binding PadR family transcriptional regulator